MKYVIVGSHPPEICPTSNSKIREMMLKGASEVPNLAKRLNVSILAGPLVNWEHETFIAVDAPSVEAVDEFISQSGLHQWNKVRVIPSRMLIPDGLKEIEKGKPIF
jgi:hypothetical protein